LRLLTFAYGSLRHYEAAAIVDCGDAKKKSESAEIA
jgi:hypothetical protein